MSRMKLRMIALPMFVLGSAAVPTSAQTTWYDDEAAWLSATGDNRLIDYDNLSTNEIVSTQYSGVTFSSTNANEPHVDDGLLGIKEPLKSPPNTMRVSSGTLGGGDWKAQFDSLLQGVGFWIGGLECLNFPNTTASLRTENGDEIQKNICQIHPLSAGQDWRFIGVTSEDGIISIEVIVQATGGDSGDFVAFDNLRLDCLPAAAPTANPVIVDAGHGGMPRFISFEAGAPGELQAIRVTFPTPMPGPYGGWSGLKMWVTQPVAACENSAETISPGCSGEFLCGTGPEAPACSTNGDCCGPAPGLPQRWYAASTLQCEPFFYDWHGECLESGVTLALRCVGGTRDGKLCSTNAECQGPIYIRHEGIIPSTGPHNEPAINKTTYQLQAIGEACDVTKEADYSAALPLTTSKWGDTVRDLTVSPYPPPECLVTILDVLAQLAKFQNTKLASVSARMDLLGAVAPKDLPDHVIDIGDVVQGLFAFLGTKYPPPAIPGVPRAKPCQP